MPVKVLQLISSGGYYGAENMLLNLATSQEKAGCRNSLLLFHNVHQPNLEFYERAQNSSLNVKMVRCKGRADWRTVREIQKCMREDSVDLIHTHGYKADLYGYLAARSTAKPLVATCHNWIGGTAALEIYNRLDRFVLKRFNAIAAVSETVANRLRIFGISQTKIKTISNGLHVEEFEGCPRAVPPLCHDGVCHDGVCQDGSREDGSKKVIGMVARLDLQKGFEYLLRAVRDLLKMFPGIVLVIVGEGPDRKAIESMVQEYSLGSNVVLAGRRNDMPGVYAAMDIFVLPSLNEGLPMTLLEAMASSRPVVATRVGAIPSVIADGENGFLVGPRDAAGLKNAISRLLANPDLGQRLGARAHDWVNRHYTADAMAQKYRQLYEEVLEGQKNLAAAQAQRLNGSDARARSL